MFGKRKTIERFAWFEPWLARGGQPPREALQDLKARGVRVVVNLRERDTRGDVERAGLDYVQIPVKNDHAPSMEQIRQWLALCRECRPGRPIFVHCKGGEGRTSVFCAALRLAQGRAIEEVIAEERRFDFKPEEEHAAQARFLYEFADAVKRDGSTLTRL